MNIDYNLCVSCESEKDLREIGSKEVDGKPQAVMLCNECMATMENEDIYRLQRKLKI